tara:strand:+ start:46074 stop:48803 length:2730 start_codon:yes stop_codon:yes gene_type:complete
VTNIVAKDSYHICYFSLNNEKEFKVMDEFTEKLNKLSPRKITVKEYLSEGGEPNKSFIKMIESGEQCDGLVISGHHTGSFGGARASGSLGIDFLESLRCKPEYQEWFEKIQALWLQGCRTLGVNISADDTNAQDVNADAHMFRVGAVLEEDHLDQSFADLGIEFSATLDQDNPLSSRYLKLFPRSSVFGWTKTAPGEKWNSEYSIPYHMAHISRLTDDRNKHFKNPLKDELDPATAAKYANILISVLNDKSSKSKDSNCYNVVDEDTAVKGWINHGSYEKHSLPFSFANDDLTAYTSLFKDGNPLLDKSREIDCLLKGEQDKENLDLVFNVILSDERLLGYSYNSVFELLKSLKSSGDISSYVFLQNKLKNSQTFTHFIQRKLASNQLSLIKKIEYLAFLKEVTGNEYTQVRESMLSLAIEQLNVKKRSENDYDLTDYKYTLIEALGKHKFLDQKTSVKIMNLSNLSLKDKSLIYGYLTNDLGYEKDESIENDLISKLITSAKKKVKLNIDTEGEITSYVQSVYERRDDLIESFSSTGILNAKNILKFLDNNPDEIYTTAILSYIPYDVSPKDRIKILKTIEEKQLIPEKYQNELMYQFYNSLEDAKDVTPELFNLSLEMANKYDMHLSLRYMLEDLMSSGEYQNVDKNSLLDTYIKLYKDHGEKLTGTGSALDFIHQESENLDNISSKLGFLLDKKMYCNSNCFKNLTLNKDIRLLDRNPKLIEKIFEKLESYSFDEYLDNLNNHRIDSDVSDEATQEIVEFIINKDEIRSNLDNFIRFLKKLSLNQNIDNYLLATIKAESCKSRCRKDVISLLADIEYPSMMAFEIISYAESRLEDSWDTKNFIISLNKIKYPIPGIKSIYNKVQQRVNSSSADYSDYDQRKINDLLRESEHLTFKDKFFMFMDDLF